MGCSASLSVESNDQFIITDVKSTITVLDHSLTTETLNSVSLQDNNVICMNDFFEYMNDATTKTVEYTHRSSTNLRGGIKLVMVGK